MNQYRKLLVAMAVLLMAVAGHAATISGKVTNATTSKPSAGDEVVLLRLAQGMDEGGRTKTDASGQYSFNVEDAGPHLVRVIHQGVTYHKQVPPGVTTADVEVFDAAKKIEGITMTVQVMRMQAAGGQLQVSELYALKNASTPPRTLMADQTFQIELPPGAQVDSSMAVSGSGLPVNTAPVPDGKQKDRYYFVFPLRPGETRFQVNYHLAYSGEASLTARALYPMEHFVAIVPKAMQFTPADATKFSSMDAEAGANTQVSTAVKPGDPIAFKVAGTGEFPRESEAAADAGGAASGAAGGASGEASTPRPGGGLGLPSEAPDPLRQYRWYILGGLAVAMVAGAAYVLRHGPARQAAAAAAAAVPPARGAAGVARPGPAVGARATSTAGERATQAVGGNGAVRPTMLMEALKEELFQLEVERQQGHISEEEYQRAKSALDLTIGRAIRRAATTAKT